MSSFIRKNSMGKVKHAASSDVVDQSKKKAGLRIGNLPL